MSADTVFYRTETGRKPRITFDFVTQFYANVAEELKSPATLNFIAKTKIPNERELYGLLVKSLLKVGEKDDIGHVATEVQVTRTSNNDESKPNSTGRVDILVNYRKTIFLIEVKVVRISVNGPTLKSGQHPKAVRSWNSAVDQLSGIVSDDVQDRFNQSVKKIALVICVYYDGRAEMHLRDSVPVVSLPHNKIYESIDEKSEHEIGYDWHSSFEKPIETLKRSSMAAINGTTLWLHGFSMFAGTVD